MFREFLDIQREKRYKYETSVMFRSSNLVSRAMKSWKKYMTDNYELFVKKKALVKLLRERNCPYTFKKWSLFAAQHKVYRIKSEKAKGFLNSNLMAKSLIGLHTN